MLSCVMMVAVVSSCEKMSLSDDRKVGSQEKANVVLRVSRFEQTPFAPATRTEVGSLCSRINFLLYDEEGERVRQENQVLGDEDFGQARFYIPDGHYYLVVLAHSSQGNPTSTNARRIGFTNKTGFTDTFLYADSLIVDGQSIDRSLDLERIVSMIRFVFRDQIPARADSIRFMYEGGSGTLDATGDGWGVVKSKQVQWFPVSHTETKFEIYTIPRADSQYLKVTAQTFSHGANIVSERDIDSIPIVRNRITTCDGYLFSPVYQTNFRITINDDWDGEIHYDF